MTGPKTRARKRASRCYELAFNSLLDMQDPGEWRLVHGEVDCYDPASGSSRMGHAWLENRAEVFDPVANRHYSREDYYSLGRAAVVRRYTKIEAAHVMIKEGHTGPWPVN